MVAAADAMLAVDPSRDGWPVLSCSKAAILAVGAGLHQPAGVPFWTLFDIYQPDGGLESYGSLRSMDSIGSPGLPPLPRSDASMSSAPPAFSTILAHGSALAERQDRADSLRQAPSTPEAAQWLLAVGQPFSLSCRPRGPGQQPSSGGSSYLGSQGPLAGWAEEAADKLLPQPANARWSMSAPRISADTRHLQHAAAQPATPGRLQRPGSLDSALAVMQQSSGTAGREDVFAVSFAPCTADLLQGLGAGAASDLPSASADSSGVSDSGSLPPCWIVTVRPQPEITTGSLRRAHSACLTNGEDVEAFLNQDALQDVRLGRLIGAGAYGRCARDGVSGVAGAECCEHSAAAAVAAFAGASCNAGCVSTSASSGFAPHTCSAQAWRCCPCAEQVPAPLRPGSRPAGHTLGAGGTSEWL